MGKLTQFDLIRQQVRPAETKICLVVMDGLGGLPAAPGGPTALEAADTPNMDRLAAEGMCGLHEAVGPGITTGSGPAHLALFGYDPLEFQVGRGVMAALGIDLDLQPQDVAARGNFCTVDEEGRIVDRRAGRIATELNRELVGILREIRLPEVEVQIETVADYRFVLVLRGAGLSGAVTDTDPQRTGVPPKPPQPQEPQAARTAELVAQFVEQAGQKLAGQKLAGRSPANMVLLRGFSQRPNWPSMQAAFGMKAAAITVHPTYRGMARLVGMQVLPGARSLSEQMDRLEQHWADYDFFFIHAKDADLAGEDGDFGRKVAAIEAVDAALPRLLRLKPDVVAVTGDHSTPVPLKTHSWHPVPALLWAATARPDGVTRFGERPCMAGSLGPRFPAVELMPLMLAHALRIEKFGA